MNNFSLKRWKLKPVQQHLGSCPHIMRTPDKIRPFFCNYNADFCGNHVKWQKDWSYWHPMPYVSSQGWSPHSETRGKIVFQALTDSRDSLARWHLLAVANVLVKSIEVLLFKQHWIYSLGILYCISYSVYCMYYIYTWNQTYDQFLVKLPSHAAWIFNFIVFIDSLP